MIRNIQILNEEPMGLTCSFELEEKNETFHCFICYSKKFNIITIPEEVEVASGENNGQTMILTNEQRKEIGKAFLNQKNFRVRNIFNPTKTLFDF